jgi:hypothetical protein
MTAKGIVQTDAVTAEGCADSEGWSLPRRDRLTIEASLVTLAEWPGVPHLSGLR